MATKVITINPEILAQRLEAAARRYEELASRAGKDVLMASGLSFQARESREWAQALRNIAAVGFDGADNIEIICNP